MTRRCCSGWSFSRAALHELPADRGLVRRSLEVFFLGVAADFIYRGADLPDEDVGQRAHHRPTIFMQDENEDVEDLERRKQEKYQRPIYTEYGEDVTDVDQQALLPSVKDPKLWMVKCAIGQECETVICLMQKFIDRPDIQIRSALSLDHLKNYIYVEADKAAHVKEACRGWRNIFSSAKIMLVPIKEMADILSVESKSADLYIDTWVQMKFGIYKGDLAKVVDVDNVRQKVTVKLIPRVDLQMIANKLVVSEDLPSNLCAIRDYVEKVLPTNDPLQQDADIIPVNNAVHFPKSKPADKGSSLDASNSLRQRPKVPDLQSNIEVLKAELLKFIAENGQEGFMPVRRQLRLHGRVDIKKAI
ncbi:hypothetical protein J5N97_009535 [Dioscorea zingiberensis]|uniref:NusG-like N-terminal domain-containing protein n=1 Tax=Dioscorea zingiberensis TaxID=325984 RepID=A0A9D5CZN5_9LILI|nr:hypothetical protein J5N97_009535 [Dioscorea zingiberensis]